METPEELEAAAREEDSIKIDERDYDGESMIAVDFGRTAHDPSVDVLDETVIVVLGEKQFEFPLPADANDVTINDGILTIQ